jgi:hypothetical protein
MKVRHVLVAGLATHVLCAVALLTYFPSELAGSPELSRVALVIASVSGGLGIACYFKMRREALKRPLKDPVEPSGVPCDSLLGVGSPVLAPAGGKWWAAEVVAVLSGDRVIVRFDGASAFWDQTYARTALQEPKKG